MTPPSTTPPSEWTAIGCLSTSRADAGIYQPLLAALAADGNRRIVCFAGGTHNDESFGRTVNDLAGIRGVTVVPVDHFVPGDGAVEVAATAGRATEQFSRALASTPVDMVFVLGDRTEMLAATLAAVIHRIPIAHLHGGDVTEGAYDEQCRHAVTKLAHLHFPALRQHAERIESMGEEPWRVFPVGALALDELTSFKPEPAEELGRILGLGFAAPVVVAAFHPETLSAQPPEQQVEELLAALRTLEAGILLLGPNADVGHERVRKALVDFAASRRNAVLVPTLGQSRFWSCLAHAAVLVGNSSAGIIEAASLGLPVVNVGDRQRGRLRPANVLDAPIRRDAIVSALHRALDPAFRQSLAGLTNPYGDGRAAERIIAALDKLPGRSLVLNKRWY